MAKIEQKKVVIDEIKSKLDNAVSVVLVDARGLTVTQDTELRKTLRAANVEYKVYKNSLINFAIQGTKFEGLQTYLSGPSAMAICYSEATKSANIINKFAKVNKQLEFKGGIVEDVLYDAKGIAAIADIPSRDELLSRLLGSFKSPMASFARLINAVAEKQQEA